MMAWKAFNALLADPKLLVLDARSARSYAERHIRGSINVELSSNRRKLDKIAGPDRPSWKDGCWWDRNVLVVSSVASQSGSKKRKRDVLDESRWGEKESSPEEKDPVVAFLKKEKNVRSMRILESDDDDCTDAFRSFAKRYPFLVTKSTKAATISGYPAEIVPGFLYLGDEEHAKAASKLEDLEITHVLTIHSDPLDIGKQFVKMFCHCVDYPEEDIARYFDPAFEFIEGARKSGARVLVHCGAGASRSATLVASYLMRARNWKVASTLQFLKEQRKQVRPNPGFVAALERYEESFAAEKATDGPLREGLVSSTSTSDVAGGYRLEVLKNGEVCGDVNLSDRELFLIGRAATCHIVLDHASISRQHAKLEILDTRALGLTDLDSVHGTFVDGRRLQKGVVHNLRLGEKIRFGASTRSYIVSHHSA